MGVTSSPATWVAGEVPTAAKLNTEIRDVAIGLQEGWDTYTPTWTASTTNPAIGNGSIVGRYRQIGNTVEFVVEITMGSTTTYGAGGYSTSLPVASHGERLLFAGNARDSSVPSTFPAFGERGSSTGVSLRALPAASGSAWVSVSPTTPFTWAVGDVLTISGTYETL